MMSQYTYLEILERNEQLISKLVQLGYQKPITDNLTLIRNHTSDPNVLASKFVEFGLVNYDKKEAIMRNSRSESDQAEQLFMTAIKHGDWKKVIDALVKTKNDYIIKELHAYVNKYPEPSHENQRTDEINVQVSL
ncbi:unnamed protein product [Allacma fusca]|uniref:Uncharacterized protein n=1 Tax=Allacma fusca TaxID=39272 RepID=A0A8J2KR53_9HEXA|nr:unnamed protein product [Allacma fusca]